MSDLDEIITPKVITRLWSHVAVGSPSICWPWTGCAQNKGYGLIGIDGHRYLVHRLVWAIHHGTIPDGMCVLHHCDNPRCCNPAHLFTGTQKDNILDMMQKGRHGYTGRPCEQNGRAKLSNTNVVAIKTALLCPYNGQRVSLTKEYGVALHVIDRIATGETWKSISI